MPSAGLANVAQVHSRSAGGAQAGLVCALSIPFPRLIRLLVIVFAGLPVDGACAAVTNGWANRMTG